ncbi:hypothetical protein CIHG_08993 [Coccidioides immitis H538.4]|uniref:Uncharacterized protein n=2 Tax=Coccidioides immitis TaxID=5501 RepID=A0A0J8UTJ4_COCIT|nr:hypothetical protein CIRG_04083 [Coccidioides immitis RMSCC 2394]KMU91058.1 hypothetical protein CIHG_08993 [Coccidioides immitis H538.4]
MTELLLCPAVFMKYEYGNPSSSVTKFQSMYETELSGDEVGMVARRPPPKTPHAHIEHAAFPERQVSAECRVFP